MARTRDLLLIPLLAWVALGSIPATPACSQDPALVPGPPRIAPSGTDLKPVRTSGDDDVCVLLSPTRLRLAWLRAPELAAAGPAPIPAALRRHGRIRIPGGEVVAEVTIAGLAPGGEPRLERVDLTVDLAPSPRPGASPEGLGFDGDKLGVARASLDHRQDEFLIIWLDFPRPPPGGEATAYRFTFESTARATGRGILEPGDLAGGDGSIVHVGMLAVGSPGPDHDVLRDLRPARVLSHWRLDLSDAAARSGNDLRAQADGPMLIFGGPRRLSELDLYLMGLIPLDEVRDVFSVDHVADPHPEPEPGDEVAFIGDRGDLGIEQIIATPEP